MSFISAKCNVILVIKVECFSISGNLFSLIESILHKDGMLHCQGYAD